MALAVSDPAVALTLAHQKKQARDAAKIAALVALYFRRRTNFDDPSAVERWLQLMIPRIIGAHAASAEVAAQYANAIRAIEVGRGGDFTFDKAMAPTLDEATLRTSLTVVGPKPLGEKLRVIRASDVDPALKQAQIDDALDTAATRIAGATARHIQNGGRNVVWNGTQADKVALGYVRITKSEHPCFFCTMLASRGIVYSADSFDESNARFDGAHNAKVHDSCACSLKPTYRRDDPALEQSAEWTQMWNDNIQGKFSGPRAILAWRQLYETGSISLAS